LTREQRATPPHPVDSIDPPKQIFEVQVCPFPVAPI
jgi:hypothetical protein